MKERPILFSGEMVRAILDGRKTQTRRAVKPQPLWAYDNKVPVKTEDADPKGAIKCPYGQPGDRLWVRETWGVISHYFDSHGNRVEWEPDRPATNIHEMPFGQGYYSGHVVYAADGHVEWAGDDDGMGEPRSAWKPSIHMPRLASRITLEIVSVRVERLQEISEADAAAEGASAVKFALVNEMRTDRDRFRALWNLINGAEAWAANPWVWCITFRRVEQ